MMQEILSITSSIISIVGLIYLAGFKVSRIELKVDTMWDYLIRGAKVEGNKNGIFTVRSPAAPTTVGRDLYKDLLPELAKFYGERCLHISDMNSFLEFERKFGNILMEKICIPNNFSMGSCLIAAFIYGREEYQSKLNHK